LFVAEVVVQRGLVCEIECAEADLRFGLAVQLAKFVEACAVERRVPILDQILRVIPVGRELDVDADDTLIETLRAAAFPAAGGSWFLRCPVHVFGIISEVDVQGWKRSSMGKRKLA
jgi:hypothetical protein